MGRKRASDVPHSAGSTMKLLKRNIPACGATIRGVTLIELMVAITVGLIILAAVSQLFVNSRSTYNTEEALARVQESGRFAIDFLARDIRMAGYLGCAGTLASADIENRSQDATDDDKFNIVGITGHTYVGAGNSNSAWSPALPNDLFPGSGIGQPLPNTDVIVIQYGDNTNIVEAPNNLNAQLKISPQSSVARNISAGSVLMVTNCDHADVFRATAVSGGSSQTTISHAANLNTSPQLSRIYGLESEVIYIATRAYYIGTGVGGEPSLYVRSSSSVSTELVSGIETLKALYGEDQTNDGIVDTYTTAPTNWRRVIQARIGVLARSPSPLGEVADTSIYNILAVTNSGTQGTVDDFDPPDDRRARRVFGTSVRLRNH